jgi:hypothetical protein
MHKILLQPSRLVLLFLLPGCLDSLDEVGEAYVERQEAITAQPDPSCTYARLGTHDYWFCSTAKTYALAKTLCDSVGMHLVRPDNATENEFVRTRIGAASWIGAGDSSVEGQWRWVNDNAQFWQGKAVGSAVGGLYSQWASAEPNDLQSAEDCGAMLSPAGTWSDISCSQKRNVVCESSAATSSQPQAPDTACTRAIRSDGHEYWSCSNPRTWNEARLNCQNVGMDLVAIEDATEASYLTGRLGGERYIGLSDREEEGTWQWSNGSATAYCGATGGRTPYGGYANWASGEPVRIDDCKSVTANGRSYWACKNRVPFATADAKCRAAGLTLATIEDPSENALLASAISVDSWLGATDRDEEGKWRWPNQVQFWQGNTGGTSIAGRFARWALGEPNSQFALDEDCAIMYGNGSGTWNDTFCAPPIQNPGFVCEGPSGAADPDQNDCVYARADGRWRAGTCDVPRGYACESVPAAARMTLEQASTVVRESHHTGTPLVSGFEIKAGANITDPFRGRERRLGLRTCVDELVPVGAATPLPGRGVEQVTYAQMYRGYRVYGRGYSVYRKPTTKLVTEVLGTIEPALDVDTTLTITEAQARDRARGAIGGNATTYPLVTPGYLLIVPRSQGPTPKWELAWVFTLRRDNRDAGVNVAISAQSGTAVLSSRNTLSCTTSPLPAPYTQSALEISALQQVMFLDPAHALATFTTKAGAALPTYLYGKGTTLDRQSPLFGKPEIAMSCGTAVWPQVMQAPAGPIGYASSPSDEQYGAAMFLASQTALDTFSRVFQTMAEGRPPWIGVDGTGAARVLLQVVRGSGNDDGYSPITDTVVFDANRQPPPGAALDVAGHELGHAIIQRFAPAQVVMDLESRAVKEGIADVLGATVEMLVRAPNVSDTDAFCLLGDAFLAPGNGQVKPCYRDFIQPINSTQPGCIDEATGRLGCPSDYYSNDYCTSQNLCRDPNRPAGDCCDEHVNATVLDHWFYLVTKGDKGLNPGRCAYQVAPLDGAQATAAGAAARIVFDAMSGRQWTSLQYPAFAEATITAAEKIHGKGSPQVDSVVHAWYAVNVREDVVDTAPPVVTPARGAKNVHPWITFTWRASATETSWDFQLDNDAFSSSSVLFEKKGITTVTTVNGQRTAYFALALPENSTSRYVWRVRPTPSSSSDPWGDCATVHWFEDTGPLTAVNAVFGLDQKGQLSPGTNFAYFPQLEGVNPFPSITYETPLLALSGYKVQMSQQNVGCTTTAGIPEYVEPPFTSTFLEAGVHAAGFSNTQPNKIYYAHVQPLGPPGFDGQPAVGPCTTVSATSGPPTRAPIVSSPVGQRFALAAPHGRDPSQPSGTSRLEWRWWVESWMKTSVLRFRTRDASGQCAGPWLATRSVPTPASCTGSSSCLATLSEDLFPQPWPGGYCWEVVGVAEDGTTKTPAAAGYWGYFVDVAQQRSPGVLASSGTAGALPKDSYGKDVTFRWGLLSNAAGYRVKVWKWTSAYGREQLSNPTTFESNVLGASTNSVVVPADVAGKGRYCWELTPLIEDPGQPGTVAAAQPKVNAGSPICYTTGPSKPIIVIDNPPPDNGYTGQTVTGYIQFDYVPDSQYTTNQGSSWSWVTTPKPWCSTYNQVFTDIVGCQRRFTIAPAEGKKVELVVAAFNSANKPGTNRPAERVHDVRRTVTFGRCGGTGERCCGGSCDASNLTCTPQDVCVGCGSSGQACCNGGCGNGLECNANKCVTCGGAGQTCCAGQCSSGLACDNRDVCATPMADLAASLSGVCPGWVTLTVSNTGTADAGSFPIGAVCGGSEQVADWGLGTHPGLAAGKTWSMLIDSKRCPRKGSLQVTLDGLDSVPDNNRGNNWAVILCP